MLWYALWFNELVWMLDIVRKFFDKPKRSRANDVYEVAVAYIKSTLILDALSSLPQVASGLDLKFNPLKILRIYQSWLLHYPFEVLVKLIYPNDSRGRSM